MWSYLLAAVGIAGLLLAGSKRKIGWGIGFFAQFLWVAYAVVTEQYGFLISAFAYAMVYARNYLKWRFEERVAQTVPPFEQEPPLVYRGRQIVPGLQTCREPSRADRLLGPGWPPPSEVRYDTLDGPEGGR